MLANLRQDSKTILGMYVWFVIFLYIEILRQGGIKWKQAKKHIFIWGFVRYFSSQVRDKIVFVLKRRWVLKTPLFA